MKRTPLKRIGKIGQRNLEAVKRLKWIYTDYGINKCEVGLPGCTLNNYLTFAHRKKRVEYIKNPVGLSDFNETILACVSCHDKLEVNKELTEQTFKLLRPKKMQ